MTTKPNRTMKLIHFALLYENSGIYRGSMLGTTPMIYRLSSFPCEIRALAEAKKVVLARRSSDVVAQQSAYPSYKTWALIRE